jgi:hypothetical protein
VSITVDHLSDLIRQSVHDADVTREEWEQALRHVFGENAPLEPLQTQPHPTDYRLEWTIDQDASTPAAAAREIWRQVFRRGPFQPNADEACVFTVTDPCSGRSVEIDLSDEQFAALFEDGA